MYQQSAKEKYIKGLEQQLAQLRAERDELEIKRKAGFNVQEEILSVFEEIDKLGDDLEYANNPFNGT